MFIVFTDLDGTLLDHHTYSYEKALEGMSVLKKNNIPLVLVSSKTFPEMKDIHNELELESPFVFENGGGIARKDNDDYSINISGMDVKELKEKFTIVPDLFNCKVKALADMDTDEIVERTGLAVEKAELAKQRKASMPFVLLEKRDITLDDLNNLNESLHRDGLTITRGGRFFHFSSLESTKGNAIGHVVSYYKKTSENDSIITIGIGDSENDIPMLKVVDKPVIVRKPDGKSIMTGIDNIFVTAGIGPAGFSECILEFIEEK